MMHQCRRLTALPLCMLSLNLHAAFDTASEMITSGKLEPTLSPYLLWMWYVLHTALSTLLNPTTECT